MSDEATRASAHVHYSGNVQGVGFRWTARNLAGGFDVGGYVRNLPDGRVELYAEGEKKEVQGFLDAVRKEMGRRIRDEKTQWGPPTGQASGFNIRH